MGLLTGAGLPFSKFAVDMRSLPAFKVLWQEVREIDGRGPPCPRSSEKHFGDVPMFEGLACTGAKCKTYMGLEAHTDDNLMSDTSLVFHLQGSITVAEPVKGWDRVAVLAAFQPRTASMHQRMLRALVGRISQCEWGCLGKGPRERPAPQKVIGGFGPTHSEVEKMSEAELQCYIKKELPAHLQFNLSPVTDEQYKAEETKQLNALCMKLGGPQLSSTSALKTAWRARKTLGLRSILFRAAAGGIPDSEVYKFGTGLPVAQCGRVFKHFLENWDQKPVIMWASSLPGRRAARASNIQEGKGKDTQAKNLKVMKRVKKDKK